MRLHVRLRIAGYAWDVGETHIMRLYIPGTYLIGYGGDYVETCHWRVSTASYVTSKKV